MYLSNVSVIAIMSFSASAANAAMVIAAPAMIAPEACDSSSIWYVV